MLTYLDPKKVYFKAKVAEIFSMALMTQSVQKQQKFFEFLLCLGYMTLEFPAMPAGQTLIELMQPLKMLGYDSKKVIFRI